MFFDQYLETQNRKQLTEHPQQIFTNYVHNSWRTFQLLYYCLRILGFADLFGKVFLITFKSSLLEVSRVLGKVSINKIPSYI